VIHDEEPETDVSAPIQDRAIGKYEIEDQEHHQDTDDDRYSESSDETVDASVQDDMEKFQETFKGIRHRYRLIKRIGEG
jgi:cell division control protein 7